DTTSFGDDAARRETLETNALLGTMGFSFDSNGNPRTTTDELGRVLTDSYDPMGRLTQETDALGDNSGSTFDAAGLELTSTDQLGRLASSSYDMFGRGLDGEDTEAAGNPAREDPL